MKLSATAKFTPRNDAGQFIAQRVTPTVVDRMEQAGALVVSIAKGICPVDSGAARDSISYRVDVVGDRVICTVYMGVEYAGYIEFGTGRAGSSSAGAGPYPYKEDWPGMASRPTLRPALDEARSQIINLFTSTPLLTE